MVAISEVRHIYRVHCDHDPALRTIRWKRNGRFRAGGYWTEICYECEREYMKTANIRRVNRVEWLLDKRRKYWAAALAKEWTAYFGRHPECQ